MIKEQRSEWQLVELSPDKSYVLLFDSNKVPRREAFEVKDILSYRFQNPPVIVMCDGFETMDTKTAWGAISAITRMVWRGIWK